MASQYEKRKAKAIKESVSQIAEAVEAVPNFDRQAYDVFYDNTTRSYIRVMIDYDSVTGAAKVRETKKLSDSQPLAIQKMNEMFVRKILGIGEKK